jgi:hypothetical protein
MIEPTLLQITDTGAADFPLPTLLSQVDFLHSTLERAGGYSLQIGVRRGLAHHSQAILLVKIFDRLARSLISVPASAGQAVGKYM